MKKAYENMNITVYKTAEREKDIVVQQLIELPESLKLKRYNIFVQDVIAYFDKWFRENEINPPTVTFEDEYFLKQGCTQKELAYINLFKLTKEHIDQYPKTIDGKIMSIRKAVKIVYDDNRNLFPEWAVNSLNKYYHLGKNLNINK